MISLPNYKSIRISAPAKKDLQLIAEYTEREWGENQKKNYLAYFNDFFRKSTSIGNIGSPHDVIVKGLFCFNIKKHTVYYRESNNEFTIIRVLHVRMDMEKKLKDI